MAESSKVRLVRCPKCENLLPELPDFSLYQCGGCGAVLEAKKKVILEDEPLEISDDIKGGGTLEDNGVAKVSDNAGAKSADAVELARNEGLSSKGSSPPLPPLPLPHENGVERPDSSNVSRRGKERITSVDSSDDEFKSYNCNRKSRPTSNGSVHGVSGQSSYYYEQGDRSRYRGHNLEGIDRIEELENGRADLLRKLEELKNQISHSGEKHKENIGISANPHVVPSYFSRPSGYAPYSDMYSYSQRGYPHDHLPYANAYKPDVFRGDPRRYMPPPFHEHFPGSMLHRHENFFHQPACSCVHCYEKNWHAPPLHNRRSQNEPANPLRRPQGNSLNLKSRQSLTMNSGELDSENDGFNYRPLRKLVIAHRSGRVVHPVGNGAPFVMCGNCFEVLKLRRSHLSTEKEQQKMKCGACSSIISFRVGNRGFVESVSADVDQLPTEIDDDDVSGVIVDDNVRYWNDDKLLGRLSSSTSFSENEGNSPAPELPLEKDDPTPDQSPENSQFEKSKMPDLDRMNSGRDATETDVSLNAFPNSNVSRDSVEITRDRRPKVNKGGDSFFTGLIKKSFRDLKKPNHSEEVGGSQVSVNGYSIPDRVVKKAEKLAGPIQPGEYWYDKRAGFWGVMGHSCLGIVMPNIEEFNYPMPKNCAAGNTGVFVNGRELHEKDFDLLASRGLPIARNRSYLIEISGRVVDEQTGEELEGLGKLAPTIEKAKHGFGMKVPRFISQSKS